jgi:hypothetical protein
MNNGTAQQNDTDEQMWLEWVRTNMKGGSHE